MPKIVIKKRMKTESEEFNEVVEESEESNEVVLDMRKVAEAISRFNIAFDSLNTVLVDKHSEVNALKFCILTSQHLLLMGEKGCAKSMLGNLAFSLIEDAKVFRKQFHKGTQVDEVFGPMDSRLYREEAIWKHNIKGMLPDCHFANLDELFRAADMLLPTMMEILNERQFRHGTSYINCPLMTAVGTTNFSSDNPELEAFIDRWAVMVNVVPLRSPKSKISAVRGHIERRKNRLLQLAVNQVEVSSEAYSLYEELVRQYQKNARNDKPVSDRRLCQAFTMAQAAHIMSLTEDAYSHEFSLSCLSSVSYGILSVNDDTAGTAFVNAYTSIVQTHLDDSVSFSRHTKLMRQLTLMEREIDPKMSGDEALEIYRKCNQFVSAMGSIPAGVVNTQRNQDLVNEIINKANRMATEVSPNVPRKYRRTTDRLIENQVKDSADEVNTAVEGRQETESGEEVT